jgi:hypothetical protein
MSGRQILTFRDDIWRANIVYGAYDAGRMAVTALRHKPPLPQQSDAVNVGPKTSSRGYAKSVSSPPPKSPLSKSPLAMSSVVESSNESESLSVW